MEEEGGEDGGGEEIGEQKSKVVSVTDRMG